jgi:Ca2+-binding RTX toxin-like protein
VTQDQTTQIIKIGFEDLYGLGDKDFNDVVIEIKINPNDAPVAKSDVFKGAEDAPITGNVLADNGNGKDSDADGDALSVVPATITTAKGGKVVLQADGTFTYTPAANFNGDDTFQYTVKDPTGANALGLVTLNVMAVNDGPVAQDDGFTGYQNNILTGNVLGNDSDIDGDVLSVAPTTVMTANGGTVVLQANGNYTYTPAINFIGPDSFAYTLLDGKGGIATGNVALVILTNAIAGQIFDDILAGNAHNDVIDAMAGNDTVNAGAGNDIVYGGDGADTLNGEAGDDTLYGGDKNDHLNGGTGADTLYGDAG